MAERLTSEETQSVGLPLNPFKRVRSIREFAGALALPETFPDRLPFVFTRSRLTQYAEVREVLENAEQLQRTVEAFSNTIKAHITTNTGEYNGKDF